MKINPKICTIVVLIFILHGSSFSQDQIADIDGNVYPTVKIGSQIWMVKNLNVSRYNNGDTIESFCYNHDTAYCRLYGRLYPWNSIIGDIKSHKLKDVCPENWHIPSDAEWNTLLDSLGGAVYAGMKLRTSEKTNFNFQWGGNYQSELDVFSFIDRKTYFWTSTEFSKTAAWMYMTGANTKNINRSTVPKEFSFSIRCVKDN